MEQADGIKHVVVMGAGPAGLTAAYELMRHAVPVIVLEKDPYYVGGISRTVEHHGYRFDIGGHRFFSKSQEIEDLWTEILGDQLLMRARLSRIYYRGKYFDYPLKAGNAFLNMGPIETARCMLSYAAARLRPVRDPRTLEDWVRNQFGRRLFSIFFKTYTEKVWGISTKELSADWAAQRIKGLDLGQAIKSALLPQRRRRGDRHAVIKTLIDQFRYPAFGPGQMWERVRQLLVAAGNTVRLGQEVVAVRHAAGRVTSVVVRGSDGALHEITGSHFISTLPIRELISRFEPALPAYVQEAANSLKYRDFLTVAVVVNRERVFPDNWIYIHDPKATVGRIQNFKNWSPSMVPDPTTTCLGMEYFCFEGDGLWEAADEQLVELARRDLNTLGICRADDVAWGVVVRQPKAYPVYDDVYKQHLAVIAEYVRGNLPNLQLVGRNGMHHYNNQDHSMMTALLAARNIALGAKYNPWLVNTDAEYHEEARITDEDPSGRLVPMPVRATRDRKAETTDQESRQGGESAELGTRVAAHIDHRSIDDDSGNTPETIPVLVPSLVPSLVLAGPDDRDLAEGDGAERGAGDEAGGVAGHSTGETGTISKWDAAEPSPRTWRWPARRSRPPGRGRHLRRVTAAILLVVVLVLLASGAISAYLQYSHLRAEASDGLAHLKHIQALLAPLQKHPAIPDAATLATVEQDLRAAEHDFASTRADLGHGLFTLAGAVPAAQSALDTVGRLSAAADEACLAGLDLMRGGDLIIPLLRSDLLAGATPVTASPTPSTPIPTPTPVGSAPSSPAPPVLTAAAVEQLRADFEDAVRRLGVAITYARTADLSALPANLITAQQRAQLQSLLVAWPRIMPQLVTVGAWLHVAPTLLGLNGPMRMLVELMDRGESRATGGYIGDYGVLTIQDGKLQPFSLIDIRMIDYPYMGRVGLLPPPPAYPWWPMPGFALRDSNLSPDFPTAARLGIKLLATEGGPEVQGAVALTAPAIARVLAVVGPITVPEYNQVVTAENLEAEIRLNTENHAVLYNELHERFTGLLGQAFMSKLHGLPPSQMIGIAQAMLTSLRTKDLQVYFTDKTTEGLLAQQGFDSALTRGPGDGLTIIDSNVSINKSNIFTTLLYTDAVTLDTDGTATHHLTITYHFDSSTNPSMQRYLEGGHHYHTYLRVYASASAQLASYDGFNGGDERINLSDEPSRQMWGGYVWVWDGIPYSLHFVWSVPGAATEDASSYLSYSLTVQHQAGANQQLALTVTVPGRAAPLLSYSGALDQDRTFNVALPMAHRLPR